MAKAVYGTKVMRTVKEYLEEHYPGILSDCVSYQANRGTNGEETLTVTLVMHGDKE